MAGSLADSMETPYGEIPQRFRKDMSAQEMHDYLKRRYSRRRFLGGTAGAGALAVAGPMLWSRSFTDTSAAGSPASWRAGPTPTRPTGPKPVVRWGLTRAYGRVAEASSELVPPPTNAPA